MRIKVLSIRNSMMVCLMLGLTACSTPQPEQASESEASQIDTQTNVVYYLCEGAPMKIQFHGEEALLNWNNKRYHLTQAISASGAYYLGEDVSFWSEKNKAAIEIDDIQEVKCQLVRVES
ncbi:Membrane-bound lysozyme inhibitor of C-type lysozyme precursor [Marinomonas spartinae]|uniref:Membrane-bound lysozyme inhibitor of C-type lysozyme n=1 Tax=Marinomonas spartinae TaxID=1792290 RepID=A0A1A8TMY6_9GAMM|nr:MliC family protein [Marinomonas spartinae]SBS35129.1 Membrane-bound lysozyme inhibitor of C-type lysozyme precursor [Marinomonas spartinae]SBS38389.1 Membrane-bound lysozyme inhibitor of C-type lysozyme precursor [Marinomonas spartinae]